MESAADNAKLIENQSKVCWKQKKKTKINSNSCFEKVEVAKSS